MKQTKKDMPGPSSCRGILIAGFTNVARTQMAEGFLRCFTENRIFIQSGGVHFATGVVHPLAEEVMKDIGIPLTGHTVHTLESARRQRATFDVLVSIDQPGELIPSPPSSVSSSSSHSPSSMRSIPQVERRGADRYQQLASVPHWYASFHEKLYHTSVQESSVWSTTESGKKTKNDGPPLNLLFPSTPSHWTFGLDASDARLRSQLWSPADPQIAHDTSTRRFQDHLYQGEPLFSTVEVNTMRKDMRFTERWHIAEVHLPFATEREEEHRRRFVEVREEIQRRCRELVRRLEEFYDERLLFVDEKWNEEGGKRNSYHRYEKKEK